MKLKSSQEGYLLIDHQASPGLPPEIAIQSGYDPKLVGEGKRYETATLTCSHCKVGVVKNHLRTRERAFCQKCHHYICDVCDYRTTLPDYSHLPYDKIVDLSIDGKLGTLHELLTKNEMV